MTSRVHSPTRRRCCSDHVWLGNAPVTKAQARDLSLPAGATPALLGRAIADVGSTHMIPMRNVRYLLAQLEYGYRGTAASFWVLIAMTVLATGRLRPSAD